MGKYTFGGRKKATDNTAIDDTTTNDNFDDFGDGGVDNLNVADDDLDNTITETYGIDHSTNNPYVDNPENETHNPDLVDDETQKLIDENQIDADNVDEMPSANESERDTGNSKKLKLAAGAVLGTVLVLAGAGISIGRHQKNVEEQKTLEAQKVAQDSKTITTDSKIDLQTVDANASLQDLPPPQVLDENGEPIPMATEAGNLPPPTPIADPIEPVAPPIPTPVPQPRYGNDTGLVAGRDYSTPAPMPSQSSGSSSLMASGNSRVDDDDEDSPSVASGGRINTPIVAPAIKGSDSGVMVDTALGKGVSGSSDDSSGANVSQVSDHQNRQGRLANNYTPTVLSDVTAGQRKGMSMLLSKGTVIPCVLKTKIDSTYQGFTLCQISKDVYSSNGKTLLIERGSNVFGEQNVQVKQGQARVAVLWTRIDTPKGVSINIDSPAAGGLGEMGIKAKVNNHFWKRFGSSIMLSMIQDGMAAAAQRWGNNGQSTDGSNNTSVSNTSTTVEGMAERALSNTINMPPTATVKQGSIVSIMVARDVDFSSVYGITRR